MSCAPARRLVMLVAAIVATGVALATGTTGSAEAQGAVNRAALVIQMGDGRVEEQCIAFDTPKLTGLDLLLRSSVPILYTQVAGQGAAICKIGSVGCGPESCLTCQGNRYWSYWHLVDGRWVYASVGAAGYQVVPGAVEGWSWPGSSAPPVKTFESICRAPSATAVPPPTGTPHPPSATAAPPTPAPSATPLPSPTTAPTARPVPPAVPPPLPIVVLQAATATPPAAPIGASATPLAAPPAASPLSSPDLTAPAATNAAGASRPPAEPSPIPPPAAGVTLVPLPVGAGTPAGATPAPTTPALVELVPVASMPPDGSTSGTPIAPQGSTLDQLGGVPARPPDPPVSQPAGATRVSLATPGGLSTPDRPSPTSEVPRFERPFDGSMDGSGRDAPSAWSATTVAPEPTRDGGESASRSGSAALPAVPGLGWPAAPLPTTAGSVSTGLAATPAATGAPPPGHPAGVILIPITPIATRTVPASDALSPRPVLSAASPPAGADGPTPIAAAAAAVASPTAAQLGRADSAPGRLTTGHLLFGVIGVGLLGALALGWPRVR